MAQIEMMVKLVAGEWTPIDELVEPYSEEGERRIFKRAWNMKDADGNDAAAFVSRPLLNFWPFKKFEWAIFAPFQGESLEEGTAKTEQAAKDAADEALRLWSQSIILEDA